MSFIDSHRDEYGVEPICRVLPIAPSTYYRHKDFRENPERLCARHWSGYRAFIKTGRSRYGDGDLLAVPGARKDGARLSLEFTIVALKGADGGIAGVAALMRDVTARFEETRELRRRLAEVSGGAASGAG